MRYPLFLLLVIGLVLLSGCGSAGTAMPTEPSSPPTPTQMASPMPAATPPASPAAPQPSATSPGETGREPPALGVPVPAPTEVSPMRTPIPAATPDAVTRVVSEIVQEIGLSEQTFLWLGWTDWINLGLSLFYVLAGYVIGTWLIRWLFPRLVRRTKTVLDDRLLRASGNEVRWLVVVFVLRFSTSRLTFLDGDIRTLLVDIYFFLALALVVLILWRLIELATQEAQDQAKKTGRQEESESLIALAVWAARFVVIVSAITVSLVHFGFDTTGLTVFLGIISLVLSVAGRDILADIVAGAVILIDRPYRIGDRIALPEIDSWGDVVEIGMRSTKVLTLNNRMVIVPNSQIGKSQIVNYSYPDPSYYDSMEVVVAYDNDAEQVGQLLVDTTRVVEGVQKEREIDALLMQFTENHMVFTIGWWIASYDDLLVVHDRVSRTVIQALSDAGVVLPYIKQRIVEKVVSE